MKTLKEQTKEFIINNAKWYFYLAIDSGYKLSDVEEIGLHLYQIKIGNMTLKYMGTVEGKAHMISSEGDIN